LFKPAGELEADRVLVGLYSPVRLAALHPDLLQEPPVDKLRDNRLCGAALRKPALTVRAYSLNFFLQPA